MKFLLLSDIHTDINSNYIQGIQSFGFMQDLKDIDCLLIAGDISGSYRETNYFLNKLRDYIVENNLKTKVCVVCGNHESYSTIEERTTRSEIISRLREEFKDIVYYLENDFLDLGDNKLVYGCCLYTDFNNSMYNERMALRCVNDFRYSYEYDIIQDAILPVTPQQYKRWNSESINEMTDFCINHKDRDIIILTHFAPSYKSISPEYIGSQLNSFYANNLDKFIETNEYIKAFCHGHVHSSFDYNIGNCRVLCAPMGYCAYDTNSCFPEYYYGVKFET